MADPVSRRRLLAGGALAVGGAALAGAAAGSALAAPAETAPVPLGSATEPFWGPHQAGIATRPQAHAVFLALDLGPGVDRAAVVRLMRLLTDDAARLTQGRPALGDTEPELAAQPARLTVTFGFGPGLFRAAGLPSPVAPLPAFGIDRLEDRWSGGDLLVQVCADDQLTVAHAHRMLVKDARPFGTVRFGQHGFRRAAGAGPVGATQRNVLGQLDGTANPAGDSTDFGAAVWIADGPMAGGTTLVLRRIRAELEAWDAVDRAGKEFAVGRRLDSGAPLTGTFEHDTPDLTARDALGFPVIADGAHVRRARTTEPGARIYRRPYNYDGPAGPDGRPDSGLVFASYQRDVAGQYLPIQRRLAEADLLNEWTTPIGSGVYAIPPGAEPGRYVGHQLLES
ncbi:peroxidase [Longispora fulva]|uniref:Dye decolorizing peroxidase n=1 Tax=Longispora fulva TaxID=619741 RepID=A0A8J7G849_9ACTN|nr:Dyp-type peroxidase [Longispora fulva]MBG6135468.1 dye decolorizing peroxidase [Longispora fulva]GIG56290.1 peroxidase [Longispora fulva]